jgi:hypothetical protein
LRNKAEYIQIPEIAKNIELIYYLLCGFDIEVELLIVVKSDNIVAILLRKMFQEAYIPFTWVLGIILSQSELRRSKLRSSLSIHVRKPPKI